MAQPTITIPERLEEMHNKLGSWRAVCKKLKCAGEDLSDMRQPGFYPGSGLAKRMGLAYKAPHLYDGWFSKRKDCDG